MFHGSLVALVTPMQADDTIDVDALRDLAEWHIQNGTDGIVVLGSTGESVTLNEGERELVIKQTIEQVRDRIPVIVGTGTNSTHTTIVFTEQALQLGADACLLVTPYYNKPTQEGLFQHYKACSEAVAIPQILYNVPSRTACDLKPDTIVRLAHCSNIIGVKEATGDLSRVQEILNECNGRLDLYSGDDLTAMDFMLAGGKGVISVTANIAPKLMHEMSLAALSGEATQAKAINDRLAELHRLMSIETNPIPVKWALSEMKKIQPGIRLPLTMLSQQHHATLRAALKAAELI